ncbi:MAG TPA: metallophosphoesterase family protein [Acidobacteriaceae bacterium]|jgi:predicted phosphodiesterase|nr:metallophosphoesterase family protein [Acidobacteriaceae bacterium]
MRALILSDIHGNLEALEAVLAAAAGSYDQLWHLGDAVGYGARPNEVIERIRELATLHVRGNHDRVVSGIASPEGFNPIAAIAAYWTSLQLTPENMDWLRAMPQGPIYPSGSAVGCVHGSPLDEDEYIVSLNDACDPLRLQKSLVTFFGHTHLQGGFSTNGKSWMEIIPAYSSEDEAESWKLELDMLGGTRYLINPGSVGQPRDFDWRAGFALFDDRDGDPTAEVVFHRVPYNVAATQKSILEAGLPDRLAWRLSEGR